MATQDLMLGEWLPDINLLFKVSHALGLHAHRSGRHPGASLVSVL